MGCDYFMISKKVLVCLIGFSMVLGLNGVYGATGLSITPHELDFSSLPPGGVGTGQFVVLNNGDEGLTIHISPNQILKDSEGFPILSDSGNVVKYLSANPSDFTLKAHESRSVIVTLTNPAGLDVKQSLGGLLVEATPTGGKPSGDVNIINKIQLIVKIVTGGVQSVKENISITPKIPPIALSGFGFPIGFDVVNIGNIRENVSGNSEVDGWMTYGIINYKDVMLYPDDKVRINGTWTPSGLSLGMVDIETVVKYNQKEKRLKNSVLVLPTPILIVLLILLIFWGLRWKGVKSPVVIRRR